LLSCPLLTEHAEEVQLHHPLLREVPGGESSTDGEPVPELSGGDDVSLAMSHSAAGRRDGELHDGKCSAETCTLSFINHCMLCTYRAAGCGVSVLVPEGSISLVQWDSSM